MSLNFGDVQAGAYRSLALTGLEYRKATGRKHTVGTSAIFIPVPNDATLGRPTFARFVTGSVIYGLFSQDETAVVPTTGADGSPQILTGDVMPIFDSATLTLIAESAAQSVTISWYWV